jgi:hypothetical protein
MTFWSFRRSAAGVLAALALAGCSHSTTEVSAFGDTNAAAYYLILSDRLRWVRDVKEVENYSGPTLKVCVGLFPDGWRGGISTVDATILGRLRNEPANQERIRFDIVSTPECLAHYTTEDGPVVAEPSDILAYAGHDPGGKCGDWIGGTSDPFEREYRVEVEDGIVTLSGGRGCAGYGRWIRT